MEKDHQNSENSDSRRRHTLILIGASAVLLVGGIFTYSQLHPSASPSINQERMIDYQYPLHEHITATIFWAGEGADSSNDFIHNRSSAWITDWVSAYGGVDHPDNRCGYVPCDFTPNENPFYFSLPFSDYTNDGVKSDDQLAVIPWHEGELPAGKSVLKNRWIQVTHEGKQGYAQWADVGPFESNDAGYVFGEDQPQSQRAGLDLSPAISDYLEIDGRGTVSWRFVDESEVPEGEWTKIITHSPPQF